MTKNILLSFDLEEFDIPEEYGQKLSEKEKFDVSSEGLKIVLKILDKLKIRATFFTTANFALHNKKIVKEIAKKHEIASHGFYHSSFSAGDFKKSRKVLEKITGKKVIGFRMPRLKKVDEKELTEAGYKYNSSYNPFFLPGRYINLLGKRTAYFSDEILNIPAASASPIVRYPLFYLSFRVTPKIFYKAASALTLKTDKYISIYFHPWEFANIKSFKLPWYFKMWCNGAMLKKTEKYLLWLKSKGQFVTFSEFYRLLSKQHS